MGLKAQGGETMGMNDPRLPQRFWNKVKLGPGGCWLWTASLKGPGYNTGRGYASFYWAGKGQSGHRVAYEVLVGTIPDGLQVDHLCRVRRCVNPEHLEPVTHRENVRRGLLLTCPHGEDAERYGGGTGGCIQCATVRYVANREKILVASRAYYAANREKVLARQKKYEAAHKKERRARQKRYTAYQQRYNKARKERRAAERQRREEVQ